MGKRTGFEGKSAPQFEEIIKNIDPNIKAKKNENFDENAKKEFLIGAKIAYETIITDFSDSDNKLTTRKPLLSKERFSLKDKLHEMLQDYALWNKRIKHPPIDSMKFA